MKYKYGPDRDMNIKIGYFVAMTYPDISADDLQDLCHAVYQIRSGSNAEDEDNYNGNGVWYLKQIDGSELDNWALYYEGHCVFSVQEDYGNYDYIVNDLNMDEIAEWSSKFCEYAEISAGIARIE